MRILSNSPNFGMGQTVDPTLDPTAVDPTLDPTAVDTSAAVTTDVPMDTGAATIDTSATMPASTGIDWAAIGRDLSSAVPVLTSIFAPSKAQTSPPAGLSPLQQAQWTMQQVQASQAAQKQAAAMAFQLKYGVSKSVALIGGVGLIAAVGLILFYPKRRSA